MAEKGQTPRQGKRAASIGFREAVQEHFGYLVDEMRFAGPEFHPDGAFYYSPEISIEVLYDERNRYVMTFASGMVGDCHVRAELSCLYVKAGLGPAQQVGWSARTSHALRKALAGQAAGVRQLLPVLKGTNRDVLLLSCHRR